MEYLVLNKFTTQSLEVFLNHQASLGWRFIQYLPAEGYVFERNPAMVTVEPVPDVVSEPPPPKPKPKRKSSRSNNKAS